MSQFNGLSWNTSISMGSSSKQASESPELIALDLFDSFQLPDNKVLLHGRTTQKIVLLDNNAIPLLSSLHNFRTYNGHTQSIINDFHEFEFDKAELEQLIKGLMQAGLFVKAAQILEKLTTSHNDTGQGKRVNVFIITCDRPQALKRLLMSMPPLDSEKFSLTVIDDSRDIKNATENQNITAEHSRDILYFGADKQKQLREILKNELPHTKSSVKFLLEGDASDKRATYGRARNYALLLSTGERLLILDDDILCQAYKPAIPDTGTVFSTQTKEAVFFTDNSQWAHLKDRATNILEEHSRYIGLPVSAILTQTPNTNTRKELLSNIHIREAIKLSDSSRIICTFNGSYGDPGIASRDWIFSLSRQTTERVISSEENCTTALTSNNCWLGRSKRTINPNFTMLSQITGIDHSTLLPPYYPHGRNEDFLFGEMMQFIYQQHPAIELPFATPHLPLKERNISIDTSIKPASSGMNYFLGHTIHQLEKTGIKVQSTEKRYQKLISLFGDLADLETTDIRNLLYNHLASLRSSSLMHMSSKKRMAAQSTAKMYHEMLDKAIQENSNSIAELASDNVIEDCTDDNQHSKLLFFKRSCKMFEQGLYDWLEITAYMSDRDTPTGNSVGYNI